jgi:hypothetical protein
MGKRSAIATTDGEIEKLFLPELDRQIAVLKWRAERPEVSASLRASAFKQLARLKKNREARLQEKE